jgi:hypothetical protein
MKYNNTTALYRCISGAKPESDLSLPASLTLTIDEWQTVDAALDLWVDGVPLDLSDTAATLIIKYKVQHAMAKVLENVADVSTEE